MREIKFRGKRIDTGEWVHGDLVHGYWLGANKFLHTAIRYTLKGIYGYPVSVYPETVGQFTGIKDKDGREIYEGDIIYSKHWNPETYKVIFEDGEFCFVTLEHIERPYTNSLHYAEYFEVISNIYDNKDLL